MIVIVMYYNISLRQYFQSASNYNEIINEPLSAYAYLHTYRRQSSSEHGPHENSSAKRIELAKNYANS